LINQKAILIGLFTERLTACGFLENDVCVCGVSTKDLLKAAIPIIANICLNNYCKRAADKRGSSKDKSKRKLATLTKGN